MSTLAFRHGSAQGAANAWPRIARLGAVLAAHVGVAAWALSATVPVRLPPEPLRMDVSLVPHVAPAAPVAPAPTPPPQAEAPPPPMPEPLVVPPPARVPEPVATPKPKPKAKPKAVEPVQQAATPPQPVTDAAPAAVAPVAAAVTSSPVSAPAAAPVLVEARYDADYLRNPPPAYPPMSRRRGEQGKVLVLVAVTPNGLAGDVSLRESSGYPRLDEAALKAVRGWRFAPARLGDNPVAATVVVPVSFRLEG